MDGHNKKSSILLYKKKFEKDPFSDTIHELGQALVELLRKKRQRTWQHLAEKTCMSQNGKKAWSTIHTLMVLKSHHQLYCMSTGCQ